MATTKNTQAPANVDTRKAKRARAAQVQAHLEAKNGTTPEVPEPQIVTPGPAFYGDLYDNLPKVEPTTPEVVVEATPTRPSTEDQVIAEIHALNPEFDTTGMALPFLRAVLKAMKQEQAKAEREAKNAEKKNEAKAARDAQAVDALVEKLTAHDPNTDWGELTLEELRKAWYKIQVKRLRKEQRKRKAQKAQETGVPVRYTRATYPLCAGCGNETGRHVGRRTDVFCTKECANDWAVNLVLTRRELLEEMGVVTPTVK